MMGWRRLQSLSMALQHWWFTRLLMVPLILLNMSAQAATCSAVFPDAISNSQTTGSIYIGIRASVSGSPDNILDTTNLSVNENFFTVFSCTTGRCSSSGTVVPAASFSSFSGGTNVVVANNSSLTLAPGNYASLTVGSGATLTMAPGQYTFSGTANFQNNSRLTINAAGTTRLFVASTVQVGSGVLLNTAPTGRYLLLYSGSTLSAQTFSTLNAAIYTQGNIQFADGSAFSGSTGVTVNGAITSAAAVSLGNYGRVNFNSTLVSSADFGTFCGDVPVTLRARYHLDELSWSGTANEVRDDVNSLHGQAIAVAGQLPRTSATLPALIGNPGTCRYGVFNGPSAGHVEIADNNLLDITDALTVSAWIYPTALTSADLATIASKDDNWEFHINPAGFIYWWWGGGTDKFMTSTVPIVLNRWQHIAITYKSGEQKIYLDGVVVGTHSATGSLSTNNLPLLIGTDYGFTSRNFIGAIDELQVYRGAMDAAAVNTLRSQTHTCASYLDHYAVSYDGGVSYSDATSIACDTATVTLTGHDASHAAVSPGLATSISLSTGTGNGRWSNASAGLVVNSGSGNATYTFATNNTVTLSLSHPQPTTTTPVQIAINSGSGNRSGENPQLTVVESGFRFVDGSGNRIGSTANPFVQTAATTSNTFYLQAVRTDTATGVCTGVFADGQNVTLRVAAECNNPTTCNGYSVVGSNNGLAAPVTTRNDNAGTGVSAYSTVPIRFGSDSKAALTVSYADVGAISLHAQYDLLNADGTDSGVDMLGSSLPIIFKPATLVITQIVSSANALLFNPATTSTGSGFMAAGEAFTLVAEARNAVGNRTPNFGREIIPESFSASLASLVYPAGGSSGVLSGAAGFAPTAIAGQQKNTALNWDEVGSFTLQLGIADGDYLGAGDVTGTPSATVGRFYPAGFVMRNSYVTNSCSAGGFSYLSEPAIGLGFELEAQSAAGAVVTNYDNQSLAYSTGTITYGAEDGDNGIDLSGRISVADTPVWRAGQSTFSSNSAALLRQQLPILGTVLRDGPFTDVKIGIAVDDSDGARLDSGDMQPGSSSDASGCGATASCEFAALSGSVNARFGRLVSSGSHGPETSALPIPLYAQYWNGTEYLLNTDDNCTSIARDRITLAATAISSSLSVAVGSGSSTASFERLTAASVGLVDGDAGLSFSAPGVAGSFELGVDLTDMPWLRHDWNQDGNYDDSLLPAATVSFGQYRGHDRIIYWREVLK